MLQMDKTELAVFLDEVFPQVEGAFTIEHLGEDALHVRLNVKEHHLRPGGTVSGPSIFALADCAVYMAVLARIGREALEPDAEVVLPSIAQIPAWLDGAQTKAA